MGADGTLTMQRIREGIIPDIVPQLRITEPVAVLCARPVAFGDHVNMELEVNHDFWMKWARMERGARWLVLREPPGRGIHAGLLILPRRTYDTAWQSREALVFGANEENLEAWPKLVPGQWIVSHYFDSTARCSFDVREFPGVAEALDRVVITDTVQWEVWT